MSREVLVSNSQVVESLDDLLAIFNQGGRNPSDFKIGMEFERFLVDAKTQRALPFDGDRGIETFLRLLADSNDSNVHWEKILDQGRLISLKAGDTAITLEPGGQVEMSCRSYRCTEDFAKELTVLDQAMNIAAEKIGAKLMASGVHPMETIETAPWMPKSRYRWMREYYEKRGNSAFEMMLLSASIQVNYDYVNEEDAKKKVFVSSFLSPIVGAIYANSSMEQGKPNGYMTRRIPIWEKTDPDRCGTPDFFIDGTFSFQKYRDYALDIPMYFALRKGEYVDVENVTFRKFLEERGGKWGPVTVGDWEFHLTTLFPEVRLKNHLEFRTCDSNSLDLVIAMSAFWKGLFFNAEMVDKWFSFFKEFTGDDLKKSMTDVSKKGLAASFGKVPVSQIARDLFKDSISYLDSCDLKNNIVFLKPIEKILTDKASPAEQLIYNFHRAQSNSVL